VKVEYFAHTDTPCDVADLWHCRFHCFFFSLYDFIINIMVLWPVITGDINKTESAWGQGYINASTMPRPC